MATGYEAGTQVDPATRPDIAAVLELIAPELARAFDRAQHQATGTQGGPFHGVG